MIKKMITAHKFFMKEGLDFVRVDPITYDEYTRGGNTVRIRNKGRIPLKSLLYSPIAYTKFMWYSFLDARLKAIELSQEGKK